MPEPIDRRQFISAATAMALLGGAAITIGCGGDSGGGSVLPPPPPPPTGPALGSVQDNHGHAATVTGAQLDAGGSVSLNIQGGSQHPHTVALTAEQVQSIKAGTRVVVQSSANEGALGVHSHNVTFN